MENVPGRTNIPSLLSLGMSSGGRYVKDGKTGKLFAGFTAAVSPAALTAMRQKARRLNYRNRTDLSLQDIASKLNPILRGWIAYYGRFQPSALGPLFRYINKLLVAWAMRKYKRFRTSKTRAGTSSEGLPEMPAALRTLETWDARRVCLMGAV